MTFSKQPQSYSEKMVHLHSLEKIPLCLEIKGPTMRMQKNHKKEKKKSVRALMQDLKVLVY